MIMGDTNLYMEDGDIVDLFTESNFTEIEDLKDKPTNVAQTEIYDRIFIHKTEYFQVNQDDFNKTGDVFNPVWMQLKIDSTDRFLENKLTKF
jgi:hypothetical protein